MCPACITMIALVAGGAASTGGLTALIARVLFRQRVAVGAAAQSHPSSREGSALSQEVHPEGDDQ